jgi:hypothetical protein
MVYRQPESRDMATSDLDRAAFKQAMKEALVETLQEQRGLFHEVFAEVLEDFALTEAIREGRQTDIVSREKVFRTLRGER